MPLELIEANPLVEETLNQVAIKRGPVVYCLESPDLPPGVRVLDVALSPTVDLVPRFDARLLGGVVIVDGRAWARPAESWDGRLYRKLKLKPAKPITARFIPYFAWANRGQSEMTVWLPLAAPSAP
jgi:DUF1680 family protein